MAAAIRTAAEADLGAALDLWRAAEAQPTATDDEAGLRTLLAHDPRALLVAEQGGELVGSLIVGWDGWRGSLYRLAVHPSQRRQGLGTALVRAGEEQLVSQGARRFTAIVADDEAPAMAFWAALGYERQAGRARFVRTLPA